MARSDMVKKALAGQMQLDAIEAMLRQQSK